MEFSQIRRAEFGTCSAGVDTPGLATLTDQAMSLIDVHSLAAHEFTLAYFRLAKKYHPDRGNRDSHELMARINAARTAILKAHQLRRR